MYNTIIHVIWGNSGYIQNENGPLLDFYVKLTCPNQQH